MGSSARLDQLKGHLAAVSDQPAPEARSASKQTGLSPRRQPARFWWDVLKRSWFQVSENNIFLAAGGVTYALLVALFPGLAAMVSIYGLALNPEQVEQQVAAMAHILPPETATMIGTQLHQLVSTSANALSIRAGIALLIALWSASRGMSGMLNALDIAYQEKETRSVVRYNLMAIGLTLFVIVGGTVTIALVGILPVVIQAVGLGAFAKWGLLIVEWPLLILGVLTGLAVLYRFGPDHEHPKWRWISPGAVIATLLWLIGSVGFTVYVTHFSSYDKTYGSLGGVVVMLTWLWLSSFVALLGAVINAEVERQIGGGGTVRDLMP